MRLIIAGALFILSFASQAASIATVAPIAHSMTSALLVDTDIKVDYLPPKRLPINRIPSWLNKNRNEPMASYDALVNISSLRPELNVYRSLRSANIRVVPIDIAEALLPGGERVAVQSPDEYFWLNTNNALLMLGILKRDLSQLWPAQSETITHNYQQVSQALRQIALEIDDTLLESGYEAVRNTRPSIKPFSKGLILPSLGDNEIEGFSVINISTQKTNDSWQIDDFSRFNKQTFIQRWKQSLGSLRASITQ